MKDTTDFLRKLDAINFVSDNAYLVSLDVKFLYTSIPKAEGIKAVKESFDKHTSKNVAAKVITYFAVILTLKNFVFNCKHYLQIKGSAMGMICALSYAISLWIPLRRNIYILSFKDSLIYLRFIDDIFFIRTGTKEQLANWLKNLNKKHNSIKFQCKISQINITFLGTEVSIQNNKLVTKICRKNTDYQNFLYIDSDHPNSL